MWRAEQFGSVLFFAEATAGFFSFECPSVHHDDARRRPICREGSVAETISRSLASRLSSSPDPEDVAWLKRATVRRMSAEPAAPRSIEQPSSSRPKACGLPRTADKVEGPQRRVPEQRWHRRTDVRLEAEVRAHGA